MVQEFYDSGVQFRVAGRAELGLRVRKEGKKQIHEDKTSLMGQ